MGKSFERMLSDPASRDLLCCLWLMSCTTMWKSVFAADKGVGWWSGGMMLQL